MKTKVYSELSALAAAVKKDQLVGKQCVYHVLPSLISISSTNNPFARRFVASKEQRVSSNNADTFIASYKRCGEHLAHPVLARFNKTENQLCAIDGNSRVRAFVKMNKPVPVIPLFCRDLSDQDAYKLTVDTEKVRFPYTGYARLMAVRKHRERGLDAKQIASIEKLSIGTIWQYIMISKAEPVMRLLSLDAIGYSTAVRLAALPSYKKCMSDPSKRSVMLSLFTRMVTARRSSKLDEKKFVTQYLGSRVADGLLIFCDVLLTTNKCDVQSILEVVKEKLGANIPGRIMSWVASASTPTHRLQTLKTLIEKRIKERV